MDYLGIVTLPMTGGARISRLAAGWSEPWLRNRLQPKGKTMSQTNDPFSNVIPFELSGSIREIAEKGVAQAREGYEKLKDAAQTGNATVEAFCESAAKGTNEFAHKLIDVARINANAAFDLSTKLVGVKTPSDILAIVSSHAREQYDAFTGHAKELADLGQKVTTEAIEPIKTGAAKVFSKAS